MKERIIKVMATIFDVPEEQLTEQSSQNSIEEWDSLNHIKMIVALEREFKINIPDEKIISMIDYKHIKSTIDECLKS